MLREILLAAMGATGFAVLFGMKKTKLWIIFLCTALAWYGYRIFCEIIEDDIIAMFAITVCVVVLAKGITLFVKGPVILFSTPVLIPFIPGATLYYMMNDLIRTDAQFKADLQLLIYQVGAMALGILVAEMIVLCAKSCLRDNV